jgi:hypothetical protein
MKVSPTTRLFYGKYPYKIETKIKGASLVQRWDTAQLRKYCTGEFKPLMYGSWSSADKSILGKYIDAAKDIFDLEFKTRAENNTLSFFIADADVYENVKKSLADWIVAVTEPANEKDLESFKDKKSTVLCDQLPHGLYKHKIYLRERMPLHTRQKFASWIKNYGETIRSPRNTTYWLSGEKRYIQGPFIYVANSQQFTLVGMFLGEYIQKTEEFVLRNTVK